MFRDATSGRISYGAGRFLDAPRRQTAASSPISTTPIARPVLLRLFATCPLPPPENWLPFSIEAGERRYVG